MKYEPEWRDGCPNHFHDTASAYNSYGCRCPIAREEARLVRKRRKEGRHLPGKVPGFGVARRVEALYAIGWTAEDLAPYWGSTGSAVVHLVRYARQHEVLRPTYNLTVNVYDKLYMTPGQSNRNRARGLREGWAPPFAWDDIDDPDEVPELYVKGKKPHSIDYEEVKFLCDSGVWVEDIAKRMGVNPSSIVRLADRRGDVVRAKKLNRGVRWGDLGK